MAAKYNFVGIDYWGSGEKSLSDFRKAFSKKIAPSDMKSVFSQVKEDYKKAHKK